MTARSDGSTSPCATTTALIAGKTKAAPERRSQGTPRVSTPYADITQIRFWGLRLSALSAPPSSGAPPSYSVVCTRFYFVPAQARTRRGPSPWSGLVLDRPIQSWGLAPTPHSLMCSGPITSGGFPLLRVADHCDVAARRRDEPRDDQDRERYECEDLHLRLLRSGTRLRGAATRRDRGLPRSRGRAVRRRRRSASRSRTS